MPYTHYHDGSFHRHRQRRKGGRHWREVRRRQRPWRIAFVVMLIAVLVTGCVLVIGGRFDNQPVTLGLPKVVEEALTSRQQTQTNTTTPTAATSPPDTPRPTPSATRLPTETPAPTEVVAPNLRHIEEKRYMLNLINAERKAAGVATLVLGDNIAAQLHAESSLKNCSSSHWGKDGLKPYMRYSLAGGFQSNGENGSGTDYCIKASDGYRSIAGIRQEIQEAMDGWMRSSGHRRNLLDPTHRKINIGLAWNRYNSVMYQHFEGDFVEYDHLPTVADGMLTLSGKTKNGVELRQTQDLGIQLYYDPPPVTLTGGQLARTYCYGHGLLVASFREPLSGGAYWTANEFTTSYSPCPDPNDVPADAPAPRSPSEAHTIWQQMYDASQGRQPQSITVPWHTAKEWRTNATSFAVRADISDTLRRHGDGVYTVVVWGSLGGRDEVISEYSMFHGVAPPDTYRPAGR